MLTELEVQWVDLSEIERTGLELPPGCPAFPAFFPLLDNSVPQFSLCRKKILLSALLSSLICGEDRAGY